MHKHILAICLASAFGIQHLHAQCTPKAQYADSSAGVWPSIVENLPCAFADNPNGYSTAIDIKTLTDTTISYMGQSFVASIRAIKISDYSGLPEGFTFAPNQPVWENGGSSPNFTPVQGCISIEAPASAVQLLSNANPNGIDYNLKIYVDFQLDSIKPDIPMISGMLYGKWLSEINQEPLKPVEVNGYQIRVRSITNSICAPLLLSVAEPMKATGLSVYPNPANGYTRIAFRAEKHNDIQLSVFNSTGSLVESRSIQSLPGENSLELQTGNYAAGLYHFTLNTGSEMQSGSFIRTKE